MELFAAFALLWRHRLLLLLGLVIAVALGWKAMQGPTTHVGTASTRIRLDTPQSELTDMEPKGADTLAGRAQVLGDMTQTDTLKGRIARQMRIDPAQLLIRADYDSAPLIGTPLPKAALDAAFSAPTRYALAVQALPDLPIIRVDASGPRPQDAVRLAGAAFSVLRGQVAAYNGRPDNQPLVVEQLGRVRLKDISSGPRKSVALAAALAVFMFWCFGVMLVATLVRSARIRRPLQLEVRGEV